MNAGNKWLSTAAAWTYWSEAEDAGLEVRQQQTV